MSVTEKAGLTSMTVFIGWAGETSKAIASILRNWLAGMFDNHINIFTPDNLATGSLWFVALNEALTTVVDCGLLCLTADNANSPWLAYEAGALRQKTELVIPLLFEVSSVMQLSDPLRRFPALSFGFESMLEVVYQLNDLCGDKRLSEQELERRFQARYPTLQALIKEKLSEMKSQVLPTPDNSTHDSKFDEILSRLTELQEGLAGLQTKISPANSPRVNL